jgi:transcriptional regulator with XRE-family HTH domain
MGEREAFGPNLRRVRVQRGISLERIAASTKVGVDLWSALERSDFSRWPTGIYARAYVRAYATEIGADPDATVDTFCRLFPNGDRRAERVVRGQAELVGHSLQWEDDLGGSTTVEKRAIPQTSSPEAPAFVGTRGGRLTAALIDLTAVAGLAGAATTLLPVRWPATLAVVALAYHAASLIALGSTPAVWALDTYIASRHPTKIRTAGAPRFLRLLQRSETSRSA